jgi:hypothetical protein
MSRVNQTNHTSPRDDIMVGIHRIMTLSFSATTADLFYRDFIHLPCYYYSQCIL